MTPLQLRDQGYWAVRSGPYLGNGGFGNSPLWYFNGGTLTQAIGLTWQSQLGSAGSTGQMYIGKLSRSHEHWKLVPDVHHAVLTGGYDSRSFFSSVWESARSLMYKVSYRLGSASSVAARTSDGLTIIAYVPNGSAATITIHMSKLTDPGSQANCWWFNPRDGSDTLIGVYPTSGTRKFTPPDTNDWILVIDSLSARFAAPGTADLWERRL